MIKQEYSMYEIITMTPGMAEEVLIDEMSKTNPDKELIKNLIQHSWLEDVNVQSKNGSTALILASEWGHTEIVRMLLERPEIDVNLQNSGGSTALMKALWYGRTEIVRTLLKRPEIDVNLQNERGMTALMFASEEGRTEIVNLIKSHRNLQNS